MLGPSSALRTGVSEIRRSARRSPRRRTPLQDRAGKQTATRERSPLKMIEERVAHRYESPGAGYGGQGGFDALRAEDAPGLVDGRGLRFVFETEVGVYPLLLMSREPAR